MGMRIAHKTIRARTALNKCKDLLAPIHSDLDLELVAAANWERDSKRGYVAEEHINALADVLGVVDAAIARMKRAPKEA
jgi:hypothetical protein